MSMQHACSIVMFKFDSGRLKLDILFYIEHKTYLLDESEEWASFCTVRLVLSLNAVL